MYFFKFKGQQRRVRVNNSISNVSEHYYERNEQNAIFIFKTLIWGNLSEYECKKYTGLQVLITQFQPSPIHGQNCFLSSPPFPPQLFVDYFGANHKYHMILSVNISLCISKQ